MGGLQQYCCVETDEHFHGIGPDFYMAKIIGYDIDTPTSLSDPSRPHKYFKFAFLNHFSPKSLFLFLDQNKKNFAFHSSGPDDIRN